jgi:hypothetical protein
VIAFFTILQLHNDPFRLALAAPLPIQWGTGGSNNANKILDQVFLTIFGKVDHLDLTVLHGQQLLDIVEPKAGLEPAPGVTIRDVRFMGVCVQFHRLILAQMFLFVNECTQIEVSNSIPHGHAEMGMV